METAKVDIEKLQLLNDRINQTIEALNQVRMSVHGLTTARTQGMPFPQAQFGGVGLSHTGVGGQFPGQQQNPWVQPQQQNPWLLQQIPWLQQQGIQGGYGLSHSGFDPYRQYQADPYAYARIVQTFPFLVSEAPGMRQFF